MSEATTPELWPGFVGDVVGLESDDRPVPELGLDDAAAAMALVAATRAIISATSADHVVLALSQFVVNLGGEVLPASLATTSIPVDLSFGVCGPLVAVADPLSVAQMRLEQLLPLLVEDARVAVARLRRLEDVELTSRSQALGPPDAQGV